MNDFYSSIRSWSSAQTKIEGSRFIAELFPADSEGEAKGKIETVRRKYFDATHHCFAYVIGVGMDIVRYSDDGEPSGSAGVKIHSVLQSHRLSDIVCVVTRYFGGTKLGVGGLGRAYHDAAAAAVAGAAIVTKARMALVTLAYSFEQTNAVMNLINIRKLKIDAIEYSPDKAKVTVLLLPSQTDDVRSAVTDATRGRIEWNQTGERVMTL